MEVRFLKFSVLLKITLFDICVSAVFSVNPLYSNLIAIRTVFPDSLNFLCCWHIEQNLKKKTLSLKRSKDQEKKDLANKIMKLPYIEEVKDYDNIYKQIITNKKIDDNMKTYLEDRHKEREIWVKCFIKTTFTCGTLTTSRIESKHRIYKRYLNDQTRLSELFLVFADVEKEEIKNCQKKIKNLNSLENSKLSENFLLKKCYPIYSDFAIKRVKVALLDAMNYTVQKKNKVW